MKILVSFLFILASASYAFAGIQLSDGQHTCSPTAPPAPAYSVQVTSPNLTNGDATAYHWDESTGRYVNVNGFSYEFTENDTNPPLVVFVYRNGSMTIQSGTVPGG